MVGTEHSRDYDAKAPVKVRVRRWSSLATEHEWTAPSDVRFTQQGLSAIAFSPNGDYVFLPGVGQDRTHEASSGKIVWSVAEHTDSVAAFSEHQAIVVSSTKLTVVELPSGRAQRASVDCLDASGEQLNQQLDVTQRAFVRSCERGELSVEWASGKPRTQRHKGAEAIQLGPNGAMSMLRDGVLWLRSSRDGSLHAARQGESALVRRVGSAELRRIGGDACTIADRRVDCEIKLATDGRFAYQVVDGILGFLHTTSQKAAGGFAYTVGAPTKSPGQPLRVNVRRLDENRFVADSAWAQRRIDGDIGVEVTLTLRNHGTGQKSAPQGDKLTPLRPADPNTAFPDPVFHVGGLDLYHEPGRMMAQTMWAAPSGQSTPVLRFLFGYGFAIVYDAFNHVQILGDRETAVQFLRCVQGDGSRTLLLPFSSCTAQAEAEIL